MKLTKDRIGAFFFLTLSILYGYYASEIHLFPGDEYEPMTARTVPYFLAILGIFFSFILLVSNDTTTTEDDGQPKYWIPVILLILLTVIYGFALDWLGFIVSTILFLLCGFRILGETRWSRLLGISIPFVLIFWFGLTQLLEIYLAPGKLFATLFAT